MPPNALSPAALCLIALWLVVLGGAIGSFINVVIYRLPAGLSLIEPGSHCPACKHPIRWYDNVPVVGWILLRGRCRDCRAEISARYPTIEAATAALFLVLGVVECLSGGVNLPSRPVPVVDGTIIRPFTSGQLGGIYAYHLLLLCTLLAAAMIEYDGHRLPLPVMIPALIVGWLAPLAWPYLHPVPAGGGLNEEGWIAGLSDATAGLAVGGVLGMAVRLVIRPPRQFGPVLTTACTGLFLGWQAAIVLAVATTAIYLPFRILGRNRPGGPRIPPTAWLALGALAWILAWRPLVERWPALG